MTDCYMFFYVCCPSLLLHDSVEVKSNSIVIVIFILTMFFVSLEKKEFCENLAVNGVLYVFCSELVIEIC
jgi:hypothetical protein